MHLRTPLLPLIAVGAFALAGYAFQAAQSGAPRPADSTDFDTSNSEMRPLIERFTLDRGSITRAYPAALATPRMKQFYTDWLARLAKLNFDTMSQDGKVDYLLLRNYIDHEVRDLDLDAKAQSETAPYIPFRQTIIGFEEKRRKMEPINSQQAAAALNALAKQVDEARRTVEAQLRADSSAQATHSRRVVGNRASTDVTGLRNTLRAWFSFYDGYDPLFTWWSAEPYRAVDTALQNYASFLRERVAGLRPETGESASAAPVETAGGRGGRGGAGGGRGGAGGGRGGGGGGATGARAGDSGDIVGDPIGRDGLMNELAHEMIPYTPEELITLAEKEFVWCETEMRRAAREMGFGDDWKAALEKVKGMHVEPGKQPQVIRELALEAEKFLDERDLITIPALARESWRMEMMSPARQLVNPFFTGGETISVSYPTNSMTYEQRLMSMRGNNIPFSRATVFHELIPGHHLQGFVGNRSRPYRASIGGTPFIGEGWALYWELLLWDLKFQKTPEDRVGALFWRSHRCARIIFSLSFHLGKMTPQQCIDLLVNRVGHEPENAIGEVRRSFAGNYSPLYQAAYLLGGLQLMSLHKEVVDTGKMTNKQFHDAVLKENRIPVELIRASLIKQRLTRDYKTSWRFYPL